MYSQLKDAATNRLSVTHNLVRQPTPLQSNVDSCSSLDILETTEPTLIHVSLFDFHQISVSQRIQNSNDGCTSTNLA